MRLVAKERLSDGVTPVTPAATGAAREAGLAKINEVYDALKA